MRIMRNIRNRQIQFVPHRKHNAPPFRVRTDERGK
jgi:hypothetical protein